MPGRGASISGLGATAAWNGLDRRDPWAILGGQLVAPHLGHGDVFLNTSDADNAPVSVTEAMACGLCVVTTDAGGLRDLVDDGEDALVVPRDDPEAMAAAVRRLLAEPRLAARLSAAARAKVEPLSWSLLLPEWEALLRANTRPLRPSETDR
jgi:glycosyltransferase involved in cell wall biosynthesis